MANPIPIEVDREAEGAAEPVCDELLTMLIHEHRAYTRPALERLWDYYRNELDFTAGDENRAYTAAQQRGLPARLTRCPGEASRSVDLGGGRREVVIENDIAWRIHTLVDFMFARPPLIRSKARDPQMADAIERAVNAAIEANGGLCFYQDMALLGSVYGFVDVLLRTSPGGSASGNRPAVSPASKQVDVERAVDAAAHLAIETVEAPRAIPVLDPSDYRRLVGYALHYTKTLNEVDRDSFLARLVDAAGRRRRRQATVEVTEVWTAESHRIYHDHELIAEEANPLGRLPIVHVQNLPQPFFYEGLSEVEPLIPLQDELNTRLSDRANRVTMQSFKMYLGKGIDNFIERPVGPGQMWQTDNEHASIEAFGGDESSPSEDSHISEIRQAMDKASAVTPVAAGVIGGKIGNLTSENALRVVLMGLLARTEKKRLTYGKAIERLGELILHTLDAAGALHTLPEDRGLELKWPSMLPENQTQILQDAKLKLELGVPKQTILKELGYADA